MRGLAGRRALVTGAASGIGLATAARFRAEGMAVLTVDRVEGCDLVLDVAAAGAAEAMVEAARARLGGLDLLFANAGITAAQPLDGHPDALWEEMLAIDLSSIFRLCRAAVPLLEAGGHGVILMTGSVMSSFGAAGMAAYAAAKHGVLGLARALGVELGPRGIRVACIQPGAILTGMTRGPFEAQPEFAAYWRDKAALRRLGTPDDIAGVAAFLASDDAAFVTATAVVVDGGATAHP
jgi:NAD(P)-dependent dehydrogenase (short-subunit alcohol dehydrogenase family)